MKVVSFLVLFLLGMSVVAQDRSIQFEEISFEKALAKAKEENKLLFVDCYTSWCGPCKMLARDVFTNNEVADYFNTHFISLKVDCEKGEGPALKQRFGVSGFPTLLFINGEGKVVNKIIGASEQPMFLKNVKAGLDPNTSLSGKEKKYEEGNRDQEFILDLIQEYQKSREAKKAKALSIELLESLSENEILTSEMWKIISYYNVSPYNSEWWNFILNHDKEYIDLVGQDALAAKIGSTMHPYLFGYICGFRKADSKKEFKAYEKLIDKYQPHQKDILYAFIELGESRCLDDFDDYFDTVQKVIPRLDISEHYRFFCNSLDYIVTHANAGQKQQLEDLLKQSQAKQNEYIKPFYQKFLDQFKS